MTPPRLCLDCHEPFTGHARRGRCRRCAERAYYRGNPLPKKRSAALWEKNNRARRNAIVDRYRRRTGRAVPVELRELRRALARLETALARSEIRS